MGKGKEKKGRESQEEENQERGNKDNVLRSGEGKTMRKRNCSEDEQKKLQLPCPKGGNASGPRARSFLGIPGWQGKPLFLLMKSLDGSRSLFLVLY